MKYKRFEDLPVWQAAVELAVRTCEVMGSGRIKGPAGLRDQIERAALSVSNNIAEGFERGTHAELVSFLYIASGSVGEVRSMTYVLERLDHSAEGGEILSDLRALTQTISRQLHAWLESLKDSDSPGPRHINSATRATSETTRRRDAFLEHLRQVRDQGLRPVSPSDDPSAHP